MSNPIWRRFPGASGIRCVEMKDQVQGRVALETRGFSGDGLVAYFRTASERFWREMGRSYPTAEPTPMVVRESGDDIPEKD